MQSQSHKFAFNRRLQCAQRAKLQNTTVPVTVPVSYMIVERFVKTAHH